MMNTGKQALLGVMAVTGLLAAGLTTAGIRSDRAEKKQAVKPQTGTVAARLAAVPPMQIGMNLGPPTYWTSEWPFADLVQSTGTLVVTNMPNWTQLNEPRSPLPLDVTGRPGPVPARATIGTILQLGSERLPVGTYNCRISPGWRIEVGGAGGGWTLIGSPEAPNGRFGMRVTDPDPKAGIILYTKPKKDGARLDELSCRMDGVADTETFNPAFLADNRPYRVVRFMDWMQTNEPGRRTWATRTTPKSFSQLHPGGIAIEHMVALANILDADPWFTLPIDADADYYRQFAEYVRDNLKPGRRAYVELANEVWNSGFPQAKLAEAEGRKRYPKAAPDEASDYYYADRVREMMDIWSQVFGSQRDRIVRVLASQSAWKGRIERTVGHGDVARHIDAIATAPYFGTDGTRQWNLSGAARVDAIFADGPRIVDEAISQAKAAKEVATRHGLRYVAYEGGPGFTSHAPAFQPDLKAVENDPRMETLYRAFLQRWKNEIGDLLVVYNGVSTSDHGNLFGHRKYTGQPLSEAPKARALLDPAWGARVPAPAR